MNKRLYVGNLSNEVTENDLTHNFSSIGKVVSVAIIKDKYSRQSKGFGFVEMETEDEAKKAIEQFNGKSLGNRDLTVNAARPREERTGGGYRSNSGRGGGSGRSGGGGSWR
jgi:RNA recognition motif-containing protein